MKTDHWRFESEYRFITTDEYITVSGHIQRVVLGARCKPADRLRVKEMLPSGATLVKAHLDSDSVRVRVIH